MHAETGILFRQHCGPIVTASRMVRQRRGRQPGFPMKQFGNACETIFLVSRKPLETMADQHGASLNEEVGMNALVANVVVREASKARTDTHPLALIALFCGVGLLANLVMVSLGFDPSAGFF
jgi:hypothetical protein